MATPRLTSDTIQKFSGEIQHAMRPRNLLSDFSYSEGVENTGLDLDDPKAGATNIIVRATLDNNKTGVKTLIYDRNPSYSYGDNCPSDGALAEVASCVFGINTFTKAVKLPAHNLTKAMKEQINDFVAVAKKEASNSIVPRMNYDVLRALTNGISDTLVLDEFDWRTAQAGYTSGIPRNNINFGVADGDNVSVVARPVDATALADATWNGAIATYLTSATAPATAVTYKGLRKMIVEARKKNIKEIKGKSYNYVLFVTPENAESILATASDQRVLITNEPQDVKFLGWETFIINKVLIVSTPLLAGLAATNGSDGAFVVGTSTTLEFGKKVATNKLVNVENLTATSNYFPAILCGEGAVICADDLKMVFDEDGSIKSTKLCGDQFFLINDVGAVRSDYLFNPRTNEGAVGRTGYVFGDWVNQSSMVFLTTI